MKRKCQLVDDEGTTSNATMVQWCDGLLPSRAKTHPTSSQPIGRVYGVDRVYGPNGSYRSKLESSDNACNVVLQFVQTSVRKLERGMLLDRMFASLTPNNINHELCHHTDDVTCVLASRQQP
jgi:hypothetical protein